MKHFLSGRNYTDLSHKETYRTLIIQTHENNSMGSLVMTTKGFCIIFSTLFSFDFDGSNLVVHMHHKYLHSYTGEDPH